MEHWRKANEPPYWISVQEAAEAEGVSPRTMRSRAQKGQVNAQKLGATWMIDARSIRKP